MNHSHFLTQEAIQEQSHGHFAMNRELTSYKLSQHHQIIKLTDVNSEDFSKQNFDSLFPNPDDSGFIDELEEPLFDTCNVLEAPTMGIDNADDFLLANIEDAGKRTVSPEMKQAQLNFWEQSEGDDVIVNGTLKKFYFRRLGKMTIKVDNEIQGNGTQVSQESSNQEEGILLIAKDSITPFDPRLSRISHELFYLIAILKVCELCNEELCEVLGSHSERNIQLALKPLVERRLVLRRFRSHLDKRRRRLLTLRTDVQRHLEDNGYLPLQIQIPPPQLWEELSPAYFVDYSPEDWLNGKFDLNKVDTSSFDDYLTCEDAQLQKQSFLRAIELLRNGSHETTDRPKLATKPKKPWHMGKVAVKLPSYDREGYIINNNLLNKKKYNNNNNNNINTNKASHEDEAIPVTSNTPKVKMRPGSPPQDAGGVIKNSNELDIKFLTDVSTDTVRAALRDDPPNLTRVKEEFRKVLSQQNISWDQDFIGIQSRRLIGHYSAREWCNKFGRPQRDLGRLVERWVLNWMEWNSGGSSSVRLSSKQVKPELKPSPPTPDYMIAMTPQQLLSSDIARRAARANLEARGLIPPLPPEKLEQERIRTAELERLVAQCSAANGDANSAMGNISDGSSETLEGSTAIAYNGIELGSGQDIHGGVDVHSVTRSDTDAPVLDIPAAAAKCSTTDRLQRSAEPATVEPSKHVASNNNHETKTTEVISSRESYNIQRKRLLEHLTSRLRATNALPWTSELKDANTGDEVWETPRGGVIKDIGSPSFGGYPRKISDIWSDLTHNLKTGVDDESAGRT